MAWAGRVSRRTFLRQAGQYGAVACGAAHLLSANVCHASEDALPQRVIDCHVHADFREPVLRHQAQTISGVDFSPAGLRREMLDTRTEQALLIGFETDGKELSRTAANPMGFQAFERDHGRDERMHFVGGINPHRLEDGDLRQIEEALKTGRVKGLKLYLGYYYFFADDDRYRPLYELAGKYDIPVILHTGDTYSANAKVRYAHPLRIDDMAVDYRQVRFVIAHLGNPWTIDAAELLYKNVNVFGDLSGFLVGDDQYFVAQQNAEGIQHAVERIRRAVAWIENPSKLVFGSDWPLAPLKPYLQFVIRAIPAEIRDRVFYSNAKSVFKLP